MSTGPAPIQFDNAEYGQGPSAPGGVMCAACKQPIVDQYFEAASQVLCGNCASMLKAGPQGGSRIWRTIEALMLGAIGGTIGAVIWFLIRKFSGYELGLIAILVGVFVGGGVRKGSRARGGWFYQLMAIGLTYLAITSTYVPLVIEDYDNEAIKVHEKTVTDATKVANVIIRHDGTVAIDDTEVTDEQWNAQLTQLKLDDGTVFRHCEGADKDAYRAPKAQAVDDLIQSLEIPTAEFQDAQFTQPLYMTFANTSFEPFKREIYFVIVCIIAIIAPFLAPAQNFLGLIIIAIALWQAWNINKKPVIAITGPFVLSPSGAIGQGSIVQVPPPVTPSSSSHASDEPTQGSTQS